MLPKTKHPKGGASVSSAIMAPTDDTYLETSVDGNDNKIHDALVEKLLTVAAKRVRGMFAKRGRRDKPEGGLFHARDNHGTDRTPDQPSVHTDSSRATESKSVQGKHRRSVKKYDLFRRHDKENGTLDRLPRKPIETLQTAV